MNGAGPTGLLGAAVAALALAGCSVSGPVSAAGGQPDQGVSPAPWAYRAQAARPDGHPQRIRISAIGVDAAVEAVGLRQDFSMDVPRQVTDVGWYSLGAVPGQPGDAVIDGHLDAPGGGPAVFWRLDQLRAGDRIEVVMSKGGTTAFRVTGAFAVPADQAPAGLFETQGASRITLVTCAGTWDAGRQAYTERFVVEASPA